MFKRIGMIAAVMAMAAGFVAAAEDLGVTIYPGARKDEQWTKVQESVLQASGGGAGACYRTKDPVAKVADFYLKNGFKLQMGQVTPDGAMLQKGDKIAMTLKNMKSIDNTNDTKICFAKK